MGYRFAVNKRDKRYRAYTAYKFLTAPVLVSTMLWALLVTAVLLILWSLDMIQETPLTMGLGLLVGSMAIGLVLNFSYATTYLPYLKREFTAKQLAGVSAGKDVNVAGGASWLLLGVIGRLSGREGWGMAEAVTALFERQEVSVLLTRLELSEGQVLRVVEQLLLPDWTEAKWAEEMLKVAETLGAEEVAIEHALAALMLQPQLSSYLRENDLQEQDVGFVVWWMTSLRLARKERARWWTKDNMLDFMGLGLSWTSGFTPLVDRFSRFPQGNLWDQIILGREQYVDRLVNTLARQRQSNVLLVGQPGVGRLGVVRELARRVQRGRAHKALDGQRVVYVHIGEILAWSKTSAGQLAMVARVLTEMERAGNIIAVIDGLGSVLAEEGEQRMNLTEVLLPFFSSLTVRVVVVLSSDEYHLRLKTNEELIHFFEVVQVLSVDERVALQVLALAIPKLERETALVIPYKTARSIVEGTAGILPQIPYPERAFDVLEEALVQAQARNQKILSVELINDLITEKVGVQVGRVEEQEREYLLNLENIMHRRIVNQRNAVATVARAMIRARAGVRDAKRPIGTFLFLGPTGVGKTETAKTLAAAYFGSEDYMSRLDMSEFQDESSMAALIGSLAHPVGRLTSLISDKPFTVLLLDEFEKAHRSVQQLFLQVFDEGHLNDVRGHPVSFEHAIIIATSNAGAEFIRGKVKDGELPVEFDRILREFILVNKIFSPELMNRFDGIVTFTPLTPEHVRKIARLMLNKLNVRLDAKHGVTVAITDELLDYLMEVGYNPEFGARPMARAIADSVEYLVAQMVLKGQIRPGEEIVMLSDQLKAVTSTG